VAALAEALRGLVRYFLRYGAFRSRSCCATSGRHDLGPTPTFFCSTAPIAIRSSSQKLWRLGFGGRLNAGRRTSTPGRTYKISRTKSPYGAHVRDSRRDVEYLGEDASDRGAITLWPITAASVLQRQIRPARPRRCWRMLVRCWDLRWDVVIRDDLLPYPLRRYSSSISATWSAPSPIALREWVWAVCSARLSRPHRLHAILPWRAVPPRNPNSGLE